MFSVRFSNISALEYSASLLAGEFYGGDSDGLTDFPNPAAGIGVTPTADWLYFPWSFTVYADDKKAGKKRAAASQPNPSLITLTPAPGEELQLNFTVRGQFMEPADSTAYIQVSCVYSSAANLSDLLDYIQKEAVQISR